MFTTTQSDTLMGFWRRHRHQCRGIGGIVDDARAGKLPGVASSPGGASFVVLDETVALAAMRKAAA